MTTPSEDLRLHPLSWVFIAGGWLKGLVLPAIAFLLVSRQGVLGGLAASYEIWSLLFVGPALAAAFVKYRVFRYRLDAREIVVRDGILVRNERHIPYGRIQNIDLVRNPVHRWLGVALVRLETAGGAKPEAVMRVLSLDAVDEMRSRVFAGRGEAGAAEMLGAVGAGAEEDPALVRMSAADLVRLGLISNRGWIVVAAAMGVVWQFDWWEYAGLGSMLRSPEAWATAARELLGVDSATVSALVEWLEGRATVVTVTIAGIVALGFFLALLLGFSIAWYFVTLHGFTLRRRGHDLRTEYGLLTRVTATIPTPRIQLLSTRETPLHRWFGRVSVQVETAGGGADDAEVDLEGLPKSEDKWLAPLVETERAPELLRAVLPEIDVETVKWNPIAARAWRRIFKRSCVVVLVPVAVLAAFVGPWALPPLLAGLALAYAHARGYVGHAAYALTPRAILFRDGWLVRRLSAVRFNKAQVVELSRSPFDRRHRMAGVKVDTAGAGKVGHEVRIPYLEAEEAEAVRERVYREAGRTSYRW